MSSSPSNSSTHSNSENLSTAKKGKSVVLMKELITLRNSGLKLDVEFDKNGEVVGTNADKYKSYIGVLSRTKVPIDIPCWRDVPVDIKEKIWDDVLTVFNIPMSKKKQASSKLAAEKQKQNIYPHRMSRGGYQKTMMKLEAKKRASDPLTCDTSMVTIERGDLWIEGGLNKDGECLNAETKETIERINLLKEQVSQGGFTPNGKDDVLTKALGTKEHYGRVRCVGGLVDHKQYFGKSSYCRGERLSKMDLDMITQMITEKGVECELDVLEKGKVALGKVFRAPNDDSRSHGRAFGLNELRMSIDVVFEGLEDIPLPLTTEEFSTVGEAQGSFVRWPKNLISLRNSQVNVKTRANETSKNKIKKKKTESSKNVKIRNNKRKESVNSNTCLKNILDTKYESRRLLSKMVTLMENGRSTTLVLNENVMGYEQTNFLTKDDITQVLDMEKLNISVIQTFLGNHWMLALVNNVDNNFVHWFDPLGHSEPSDFKNFINVCIRVYGFNGGKRKSSKAPQWVHVKHFQDTTPYSKEDIDEVRDLWADYFLNV
ncbi:hypothetical protein RND81_03G022400 [Saponaria officinalis]|uniref:DUF8039 domain-containing protein n=1 Tax=Saponaria officinalis TaxID=3572 RepID=A0AAW1M2U0_SAPOF